MEEHLYSLQYNVEKKHWWYTARQKILLAYLTHRVPSSKEVRLLDVGCGTGALLEAFASRYTAYGLDSSRRAVEFCRERGLTNVREGSLESYPKDTTFDIITLLDVVEHVDDDLQLLRNAHRVLRTEGAILITVPAFPALWSHHDVVLHHKRRYTKSTLEKVVTEAGFRIEHLTFFNTLLFPVAVIIRYVAKLTGSTEATDLEMPPPIANRFLHAIFAFERRIVPKISLPFGLSLLCWGHKTAS